ncbi:DASS family sodium-coupled anion symporter [Roseivirga sp.]|uniref:SLC13 family permease n=1 Tax=Roseivirga sp. TaxID=1964215 RepID=UPI002B26D111|nr:DASS family sodium-coupled anion symporter [Roseivirga sp.]
MSTPDFKAAKIFGLIAGPLVFFLIPALSPDLWISPDAWKVVGIAAWMIIWWITEAAPIPVTALLPIVLFQLTGVFNANEATAPYANPIIFLFMAGFILGLGMEKHNLHKRIALNLIRFTGTNPNGIILGFMLTTAFLSMWISNTATTVMMLPIALSITSLLNLDNTEDKGKKRFSLVLMLGIAYAANIGGTATIIGTPPNVAWVGFMSEMMNYEVSFAQYLKVGLPTCLIMLTITYFLLTRVLFPSRIKNLADSSQIIDDQIKSLGKISRAEKLVALIFVSTAVAWILRGNLNTWFNTTLLNDTLIGMIGAILMFATPVSLKRGEFLLDWQYTKKLPWGILLLFGGGLTLAKAMETTEIVQIVGEAIAQQGNVSRLLLVLGLSAFMLFMTEIMSNVALAVIFVPVVLGISLSLNINPMYLSLPVTLAASYAFMMPISTPPNAIVFSSGMIPMKEMIRAGFILNIVAILLLAILSETLIPLVYG